MGRRFALATTASLLALAACGKPRPPVPAATSATAVTVPQGGPEGGTVTVPLAGCTACHGQAGRDSAGADPLVAAAPPRAIAGATAPAVGAHQAHLVDGIAGRAVACASCHVLPSSPSPHPAQDQGKVTFSLVARAAWTGQPAVSPTWDGASCSATYCHGNFPNGAGAAPVSWNAPAGSIGCGGCHDLPPAASHPIASIPAGTECRACHPGYGGKRGDPASAFSVNPALHLNGTMDGGGHSAGWVDTASGARGGPHAGAANEHGVAPSATDPAACGNCHGATLSGGVGGLAAACTSCHDGGTHLGVTVVAFAPGGKPNCTACHGGTLAGSDGGSPAAPRAPAPPLATIRTSPRPDSGSHARHVLAAGTSGGIAPPASLSCGQCHASPSVWYHSDGGVDFAFGPVATGNGAVAPAATPDSGGGGATCSSTWCHGSFRNGNARTMTWGAAGSAACGTCHGDPATGDPLPPTGHPTLQAGTACGTCHTGYAGTAGGTTFAVNPALHVNGEIDALGHATPYPAAQHGPDALAPPSASRGLAYCRSCHNGGGTEDFGSSNGSSATSCNACHAPLVHAPAASWLGDCVFCHGGRSDQTGAPPRNTHVLASDLTTPQPTTDPTIGAHTTHVQAGHVTQNALDCSACHPTKWTTADPATAQGHVDQATATVAIGPVGPVGALGSYTRPTCSSTYCHGNFAYGNGAASQVGWTGNFSSFTLGCGSCHGSPPPLGASSHHPQNAACAACHGAGYATAGVTGAALLTHVDGQPQKPAPGCTACHGELAGPTGTAVGNADPRAAPGYGRTATAVDTRGNSAPSSRGVGAHDVHLRGGRSRAVACGECHAVPAAGDVGHAAAANATVAFAPTLANKAGGATYNGAGGAASVTCSSTYCHGKLGGGVGAASASPPWTAAGQLGCNACHGQGPGASALPPTTTSTGHYHPQNASCGACHAGYSATSVQASTHIDGTVQYTTPLTCTTCHGEIRGNTAALGGFDPNQASAPPNDTTGAASGGTRIGAHLAHVNPAPAGQTYPPLGCAVCHSGTVPSSPIHADGAVTVVFSGAALLNGATPNSGGTPNCSATYCHGGRFLAASRGQVANWTWAGAAATCDSCHATPPDTAGHATLAKPSPVSVCSGCHGETVDAAGTIKFTGSGAGATTTHINGNVEGGESAGGSACGGCHAATFSAMNGGTTKAFKHALGAVAGTNDSPTNTATDWSLAATLSGGVAPAGRSCVNMCHGDHPHTIPGVATHENNAYADARTQASRGTASATTRAATDHAPGSATDGLCISCHQKPIDATAGRITVTGASYNGTGHDYTQNTVGTTTYTWSFTLHDGGVFLRNCTKCHAGGAGEDQPAVSGNGLGAVHYSDNDSLLMGSSVASGGTATAATFVCYKCHGNALNGTLDRSGVDVRTQILLGRGHQAADGDGKHSTLAEAAAAFGGTAFAGAGRHVNCLDCHDPHESGKTGRAYATTATATRNQIPAGSPIAGASGVVYGTGTGKSYPALPASGAWPATTAASYGDAPTRATYEYEICFKCHTAFAFGGTSAVTTQLGPSGLAETDLGLEFSPAMRAGHPVVLPLNSYTGNTAPKALAAAQVSAPFTAVGTQTMTCTDCHAGDAAAPAAQGPHGSATTFMLRGPNKAWPGTFTLATSGSNAYNAGAGTAAGLFCLNCHPLRTGTTWANNVHSRSNHSSRTCVSCHILVPHGGKVSRLVASKGTGTSTLPTRYDGGSVVTQFRKASSPTGYSTSNCNTSCGGHGTVTTPETW